ncbi:MAG: hypothetical protein PHN44_00555 [Candidatus Marinimicrobia bacterium]|nr:hypothetical protein [Candidatus Neomarinimicrobiota bacterium]MDD5539144.1 hypothetical protein [Candidatus Neomarinimicrobiota bacterium]
MTNDIPCWQKGEISEIYDRCAARFLQEFKRDRQFLWDWLVSNTPEMLFYHTGEPIFREPCTNKDLIELVFKAKLKGI